MKNKAMDKKKAKQYAATHRDARMIDTKIMIESRGARGSEARIDR